MPKYMVWDEEAGERNAVPVTAGTPGGAAERYAAERDSRALEYPPESRVCVRSAYGGATGAAVDVFVVELRSEPVYTAKRAKGGGA